MRDRDIESVAALEAELDQARYLDAYERVGGKAGLVAEVGPEVGELHDRLAFHLGSQSLSQALARRLYRSHPGSPYARASYARHLQRRRGGYRVIEWMRAGGVTEASAAALEDLLVFTLAYLELRDVKRAEDLLARARACAPHDPFVGALRASALVVADRISEAAETYAALHSAHPDYAALNFGYVDVLTRTDRQDQAIDILRDFAERTQSGRALLEVARRAADGDDLKLADRALDQAAQRLPLLDKPTARSVLALRYRVRYGMGDREGAARCLREWSTLHTDVLADRVAAADRIPGDLRLAVPRVRQGHVTCAPASLTAVCRFFGDMVEHDAVVEAICFGGTPSVRQRRWAAARDMLVKDFALSDDVGVFDVRARVVRCTIGVWRVCGVRVVTTGVQGPVSVDVGRQLIDRGLPFTLVSHTSDSSHLQVVKGYDPVREVWLTMDPSADGEVSLEWDAVDAREAFMGPAATVYLPRSEASRLEGLTLPEEASCAGLARVEDALEQGDLDSARGALEELKQRAPRSAWTCRAELALARMLSDTCGQLAAMRHWLALHPENASLQANVAELERDVGLPINTRVAHVMPWSESWDPRLLCEVARTLMAVPSRWPEAGRILRRANLASPRGSYALGCMAELAVIEQKWQLAMETSRLALCLDEAYEFAALTHFQAASRLRRQDEALAFLEEHARQVGGRSGAPLTWLARCYVDAGRPRKAIECLLTRSREERPEDGPLHLKLAQTAMSLGEHDEAHRALVRAEGALSVVQVAPLRAQLEASRDNPAAGLRCLEAALAEAPWSTPVIREYAATLASVEGTRAAREWLKEQALARPDLLGLVQCACDWLRAEPDAEAAVIECALAVHPEDPWLRRELALTYNARARPADAEALLDEVLSLNALDAVAHRLRGVTLAAQHRIREALEAFQAALAIDPTDALSMDGIGRLDLSFDDKRQVLLQFVETLEGGTPHGEDLYGVMGIARLLGPDDALELGARLVKSFPGIFMAYRCAIELALHVAREDVAEDFLRAGREVFPEATAFERFELDLARRGHDHARALAISRSLAERWPLDQGALLDYVQDLRRAGDAQLATETIEAWLGRAGEAPGARRVLAHIHAQQDPGAALDTLMPLLREGYQGDDLWLDAADHAARAQRSAEVHTLLLDLEAGRPSEPRLPWYRSMFCHGDAQRRALERARELAPEDVVVVEALAHYWTESGEHDKALAYCPPADWRAEVPIILQGRRADIVRRKGDLNAAIDSMVTILERDPGYAWGIYQLLDWSVSAQRPREHLLAARLLRRLRPADPNSFSNLAAALIESGERGEAKDVLVQGHARHPADPNIASALLNLLVSRGHLDSAGAFVGALPASATDGMRLEAEVLLSMARHDPAAARQKLFDALHAQPPRALQLGDAQPISEAWVFERSDSAELEKTLLAILRHADAETNSGFWCDLTVHVARLYPSLLRRLAKASETLSGPGLRALGIAMRRLHGPSTESLRKHLVAKRRRYPYEPELWGGVAYVLFGLERTEDVYRWTEGFEHKEGVAPWMVWYRVHSAFCSQRFFAARDAARFALTLRADENQRFFELTVAFLSWLAGEPIPFARLGARRDEERFLRDALCLLEDARERWTESATVFDAETRRALQTLLQERPGLLPWFERAALGLAQEALTRDYAKLSNRLGRGLYRRRLAKIVSANERRQRHA